MVLVIGATGLLGSEVVTATHIHGASRQSYCAGGFKNVEVAKTRIIQGSSVNVTDLSKGEHRFQCCIHPWMRMKVEVK